MQINEAISRMENHLSTGTWSETMQQAWQTLKAAVSANTTTNKRSTPFIKQCSCGKQAATVHLCDQCFEDAVS
jgi:hypothetical protein